MPASEVTSEFGSRRVQCAFHNYEANSSHEIPFRGFIKLTKPHVNPLSPMHLPLHTFEEEAGEEQQHRSEDSFSARLRSIRRSITHSPSNSTLSSRNSRTSRTSQTSRTSSPASQYAMASAVAYNDQVDEFRDAEYPMMQGRTYLDHGGATIYAKSLIEEFSAKMVGNLYGNPHSASSPAMLSGHTVDDVRAQALAFFNADPEDFDLVFTQNATASIKLVAEAFRDLGDMSTAGTFWYGFHKDAHTSLVGVRELTKDTFHCFSSDEEVESWLSSPRTARTVETSDALPCLFAYPGQSNMTGRRLPLSWARKLRESKSEMHQNAYTLLDAAALATTAQIDLSNADDAPDFVAVSFYKIFGFPDLGALIVRKDSGHILSWRKYFGGGTVNALTVLGESSKQLKDASLHDCLEDGTLPFHNIIALGCAIDVHKRLFGSMKRISQHTSYLAFRLYHGMSTLVHYNGQPLCEIYNDVGELCTYGDPITQGGTVAFNLIHANAKYVGHSYVEKQADEFGIYLRSGGLCNSGGITSYLKVDPWQFKRAWSQGHRCGEAGLDNINGKPTGVVRASLGAMSTMKDVDTFLTFLHETYLEKADQLQLTRFNDLSAHWGIEPVLSEIGRVQTIPSETSHGHTTNQSSVSSNIPWGSSNEGLLRSMHSTPNIAMQNMNGVLKRPGGRLYEIRPDTSERPVSAGNEYTGILRKSRHTGAIDNLHAFDRDANRPMHGVSSVTFDPVLTETRSSTANAKKSGAFMSIFKSRKSQGNLRKKR